MRTPPLGRPRTKASAFSDFAARSTPSPPATIRVEIAPAGLKPRATISMPEELRTGPGVAAITLIEGGWRAKRAAISNTEIGPAASSNWKSGKTRMPIIFWPCPKLREIRHFGHQTIMASCWRQAKPRKAFAMSAPLQIGLVIFPRVTQLDMTGPLQVFSSLPGAKAHLIWKRIEPGASDSVLTLTPTVTFADCPQLDVICVPGGGGTDDMVNDEEMLAFLRKQAEGAKYITSVCTGSLVLGAAGLLKGYRAATHWTAMDFLSAFGAIPTKTRVCIDRNRITGGGVTAGIDFALTLVSIMVDRPTAEAIQLRLEYNPAPPFNSGSPDTAPPEILALMREKIAPSKKRRGEAVHRAAAQLGSDVPAG